MVASVRRLGHCHFRPQESQLPLISNIFRVSPKVDPRGAGFWVSPIGFGWGAMWSITLRAWVEMGE